ncbi:hypothetical protein [Angustibacter sp. Root456]|uniref:hypothetical protein n=1 Tax=Angustibacter sp. Root456 TaxID=1736539 RepID=UPI0006FC11CC|nr:hypothetical protein [Angustibacter sp. Root456]KQX68584.1 hypothetical protein ASD06_17815 [Angustibacter sp. Root456]
MSTWPTAEVALPGHPAGVLDLAERLATVSAGLLRLTALVRAAAAADWHGVAATAFRQLVTLDAEAMGRAGAVLAQASEHLRHHAGVLRRARADVEGALLLDPLAAWDAPDVAEQRRALVRETVAEARRRVAVSAAEAAPALHAAARLAPAEPSAARRAVERAWARSREVSVGAVETSGVLLATAARFTAGRAVVDPVGYAADCVGQARGTLTQAQHPRRLARAVLDLDTFEESPSLWIGHLLPTAALGAASGAAGVATRSSSLTVRALSRTPGPRGAALREAVAGRAAYGRSGLRARDLRSVAGPPSRLGSVSYLPREAAAVGTAMARDGAWAETHLTPRVERAMHRAGGLRVGEAHAVKQAASLRRKLADEVARPELDSTTAGQRVNDTVRYTVVFGDDAYVEGAVRTIEQLRGQGFELAQAKSSWGGPRYQGLNLVWHDQQTGRLFEVQVHSPGSWDATVRTHPDYELYRDRGAWPALKAFLGRRIAAEYAAVGRPRDIADLPRRLSALGLDTAPVTTAPLLTTLDARRLLHQTGAGVLVPGAAGTGSPG